MVCFDWTR